MKTETTNYIDEATRATLNPRYVLALSFDDDNTDITYITSHADCLDPGGVAAIDRIDGALQPDGISGQTQRIAPENAQHTIGSVSFKILDVDGALTTKINTKLTGGEGLRHKRIRLYKGFEGLTSWDDYALRLTYRVEDVQYMDGVYTLSTGDIQRQAKTKIFEPHQGVLTSTLFVGAMTVPITIANAQDKFPLVYHDDKWESHINQAVGYIQIDDEIIAHSGWTDATYTALTVVERGALGTVEVEHTVTADDDDKKKKVDEYIYLHMQSPRLAYALLTGLDVPATNLISDVAKFSEFTETGSGVLVETADVGPVPWVNWYNIVDDAAIYETISFGYSYAQNQSVTASICLKNDPSKTTSIVIRLFFSNSSITSFIDFSFNISTGVNSASASGDAVINNRSSQLIGDYWVIKISGYCTNAFTNAVSFGVYPSGTGGAAITQTIQAALPFLAIGEHSGMFPLPEHWHLGIHADYTRLSDFTGIGADLWDTTNNTGRVARFMGIDGETGKSFIEKELLLWMGAYMPVHADGTLGLRRLKSVLPYAGYDAYLDSTQIIRYGALRYDQQAVINDISIDWNWIDSLERYTKTTRLFDSNSISKHGTAAQKTYEFRGVFNGVHTESDLENYFQMMADRWAAPPLRLQIDVMPQWDKIEVGDTVRVDLSQHVDYHIDDTLSRTFEVQQVRTDWITGKVSLTLFGGTEASALSLHGGFKLADAFYGSGGSLGGTDLTSVLTISAGAITANGSLTGGDYYYDGGDLTLNSGVTVTISGTVRLRVKGFFTVNGTIDGSGGGAPGGAGGTAPSGTYYGKPLRTGPAFVAVDAVRPAYGTLGQFGPTTQSAAPQRSLNSVGNYVTTYHFGESAHNMNPLLPPKSEPELLSLVNPDGLTLRGISQTDNLTGSGGGGGEATYTISLNSIGGAFDYTFGAIANGGAGGTGGGGLAIICRGMSFGASGQIDVSGTAGTSGGSGAYDGDTYHAAAGCSGWPGAVYVLIDGDGATPDRSKIITKTGNSTLPSASDFITRATFPQATASAQTFAVGFFGTYNYDHPNNSHRDHLRIQYIPRALNGFTWYPAQEAREVTGYENKPPEWDQIADSAGLKPANNATVGADYEANLANKPTEADNLVLKSAFEDNSAGSWDAATGTVVAVAGQDFSKAYQFQEHKAQHPSSEFIVEAGEVLYLSASANAASASYNVYASLEFKDSAGSTVSTTDVLTWTTGSGWSAKSGSVTVPATAKTAVPTFKINTTAPGGATGTAEMTQFRVTRAEPGATVGAQAGSNLKDSGGSTISDAQVLNSYNVLDSAITVTVGTGGDYATINAALVGLTQKFPTYQSTAARATINLLSGLAINEQVIVDGVDLSWITITSVDATVTVSITSSGLSNINPGSVGNDCRPLFAAINGGRAPILDLYLDCSSWVSGAGNQNNTIVLARGAGSIAEFTSPSKGGVGAGVGQGISATDGGLISGDQIKFDNFAAGLYATTGGVINTYLPTITNHSLGMAAYYGAVINARAAVLTGCNGGGIALEGGSINCAQASIDTPGIDFLKADSGDINARGATCATNPSGAFYAYHVINGGMIRCTGATGSVSQTVNTITTNGIIVQ